MQSVNVAQKEQQEQQRSVEHGEGAQGEQAQSVNNTEETLYRLFAFCSELDEASKRQVIADIAEQCTPGMERDAVQEMAIRITLERTTVEEPKWQYVAGSMLRVHLYDQAAHNRGLSVPGYGSLYALMEHLTRLGRYGTYMLDHYDAHEVTELEQYLEPDRDALFTYTGLKMLADRYLIRGRDNEVLELPQEMFMGVAMHLAMKEDDRVYWAKQFYDVLSKLEMTVATPTLANARKPWPQLSSCFIDTVDDNLWSIYHVDQQFAQVSKHGGGQGIYLGKVRARGSDIRGHKGVAGGVIPWVKNYNNTALSVDQLGVRQGAVAIYLDVWHADILDFLNVKTNNGDDRLKAHDIFPGVCVPDLFMKIVRERGEWHLFCPHQVREVMGFSLEDCYGDEFERKYWQCVQEEKLDKRSIPAIDIMKRMLSSQFETGTPFVFFRDTVNRLNPNKHQGMIYCSNLCTEICQNMSPTEWIAVEEDGDEVTTRVKSGDFVVCNLSSINLGRVFEETDIERVVRCAVRMMDNVIDLNDYPVAEAKMTNRKYRALGLGTSGYHQLLAQKGIAWESDEHVTYADELFETINYYAIRTSMELAQEKGTYRYFEGSEWEDGTYFSRRGYTSVKWQQLQKDVQQNGLRNAYLVAIAPTSSTSLIAGSTAGIDPIFQQFFVEEKKHAVIPQTVPSLNDKTKWYYKEAHTIDQRWSIMAAGARQRHIDQSQSFNVYVTPEVRAAAFLDMYMQAWQHGLKTIYYVRNRSIEIDDCVSCSS